MIKLLKLKLARWYYTTFSVPCKECGECKVLFWEVRCSFCDEGEGKVK